MAQWHLDDLRQSLEQRGWHIVTEQICDEYRIAATWEIQRSTQVEPLHLDFEGLDDTKTLPLTECYSCYIRENRTVSIYFSRKGHKSSSHRKNWIDEISEFLIQLDEIESVHTNRK